MPIKYYKNKNTGEIVRTLKGSPGKEWEEVIKAPNGKMMICADEATGKSKLKDQENALRERARNHSRDTMIDDLIQMNKEGGTDPSIVTQNFLDENGERRKKISDK